MAANIASAGSDAEDIQNKSPRWFAVLIAECADVLDPRISGVLQEARRRGLVPEFSRKWCINQNIFPETKGAKSES